MLSLFEDDGNLVALECGKTVDKCQAPLLEEARRRGYRHLFAVTMDTNIPSIRLLEKKGFDRWAHLPEVAIIQGQVCGQVYYGRWVVKTEG